MVEYCGTEFAVLEQVINKNKEKHSKPNDIIQIKQETEEELRLSYDNETYTEDYYENIQHYYVKKSCNNLMHICKK